MWQQRKPVRELANVAPSNVRKTSRAPPRWRCLNSATQRGREKIYSSPRNSCDTFGNRFIAITLNLNLKPEYSVLKITFANTNNFPVAWFFDRPRPMTAPLHIGPSFGDRWRNGPYLNAIWSSNQRQIVKELILHEKGLKRLVQGRGDQIKMVMVASSDPFQGCVKSVKV